MNKEEIGKRIRELRTDLSLTQEQLAEKVGYTSRSSINKIELGINDIPRVKFAQFAKAFGVSEAYILGYTDDPRPLSPQEEINALLDFYSDPSLPAGLALDDPAEIDIIKHYRLADDKTKKAVRIMLGVEE